MSTLGKAIHDCLLKLGNTSPLTDGELLGRFVAQHEEAAFQELVRRHGPMVLRVCQRMLRHAQDAEDAFQATFIVLARKAGAVAKQELVGGWLHGVAYRVALKARANRRRAHEQQLDERVAKGNQPQQPRAESMDLRSVLDEEVHRLPEKYRAAVVLHYLEGKTCEEAAQLLRCQTGALKVRLQRARERLRGRLERRGMALPACGLATFLAQETASAALSPSLAALTLRSVLAASGGTPVGVLSPSVAALAEATLPSVVGWKWKPAAALALAGFLLAGMVIGAVAFLGNSSRLAPTANEAAQVYRGRVVRSNGDQLTVILIGEKTERTFAVAVTAKITISGTNAKVADLHENLFVTLTVKNSTVIEVAATRTR